MRSFGELLKVIRVSKGIGLRECARRLDMDSGNLSKIESGLNSPPNSKKKIEPYIAALKLSLLESGMLQQAAYKYHQKELMKRFE